LPTLNLPNDPQVWPTLHYYEPFGFTHQGAFWVKPTPVTGRKYGRIDDQRLERDLNITGPLSRAPARSP
jgi:endoglucanase